MYCFKNNCENKIGEDALRTVVIITKNFPLDALNSYEYELKSSYKLIFPSSFDSSYEKKKKIILLIKEMIIQGVIKKGECGSDIVEKIMILGKNIIKKKDTLKPKEEFIEEFEDFERHAKKEGFKEENMKNDSSLLSECVFLGWIELFKDVCLIIFIYSINYYYY